MASSYSNKVIRGLANIFYPYKFCVLKPDASKIKASDVDMFAVLGNKMKISSYRNNDDNSKKYAMIYHAQNDQFLQVIQHLEKRNGYSHIQSSFAITCEPTAPTSIIHPLQNMPLTSMLAIKDSFDKAGFITEPIGKSSRMIDFMRKFARSNTSDNPDDFIIKLPMNPIDMFPYFVDTRSLYNLIYEDKKLYIKIYDNIFPCV